MGIVKFKNGVSADEAERAAGLDFDVRIAPMGYIGHDGGYRESRDSAIYHGRTGAHLGTVRTGGRYEIFQNHDLRTFAGIAAEEGKARVFSAGHYNNGASVFYQLEVGRYNVGGKDEVVRLLAITNSHTGKASATYQRMEERQVCTNGMRGIRAVGSILRIRHDSPLSEWREEARRMFADEDKAAKQSREVYDYLATSRFSDMDFSAFLDWMAPKGEGGKRTKADGQRDTLTRLFQSGRGADIFPGSAWNAFNAVTEYVDHERGTRTTDEGEREDLLLESRMFGSGAAMKDRALEHILEMVRAR